VNCRIVGWTDKNSERRALFTSTQNYVKRDEKAATRDCCCPLLFDNFSTLWRGWGTYWNQATAGAALALALLHFAIVRLDNIVVGSLTT